MEIAHPQPEAAAEIVSEKFGIPSPTGILTETFESQERLFNIIRDDRMAADDFFDRNRRPQSTALNDFSASPSIASQRTHL